MRDLFSCNNFTHPYLDYTINLGFGRQEKSLNLELRYLGLQFTSVSYQLCDNQVTSLDRFFRTLRCSNFILLITPLFSWLEVMFSYLKLPQEYIIDYHLIISVLNLK